MPPKSEKVPAKYAAAKAAKKEPRSPAKKTTKTAPIASVKTKSKPAVRKGDSEEDVDANGNTRLHKAVISSDVDAVRALLAEGFNVNATTSSKSTPLHYAASQESVDVVNVLLAAEGCNVNAADEDRNTPLHTAARRGNAVIATALLAVKGCKPNVAMRDGWTPMHLAAQSGHISVVKALLATRGCNAKVGNKFGQTPLSIAVDHGRAGVVEALLAVLRHPTVRRPPSPTERCRCTYGPSAVAPIQLMCCLPQNMRAPLSLPRTRQATQLFTSRPCAK